MNRKRLKFILFVLFFLIAVFGVVCVTPYSTSMDQTVYGLKGQMGSRNCEKISLRIRGEYKKYLFQKDEFTGQISLEGYDYTFDEKMNPIGIQIKDGSQLLQYIRNDDSKGFPLEVRNLGLLYASEDFHQILILIMNDSPWNGNSGAFACFPCEGNQDAADSLAFFHVT